MSIFVEMVSTDKWYETDNFPVLDLAQSRGEWLYRVSLYANRPKYLSKEAGTMRMRVLLGFMESRSVVIDAAVQTDGFLHYLSILCSSGASPEQFSSIMKKTAPDAVIEEISIQRSREYITASALRKNRNIPIPHAQSVKCVRESRTQLLSLLLEYRALLAECRSFVDSTDQMNEPADDADSRESFSIPFVFFEIDGTVHGVPEFQIEAIDSGSVGKQVLRVAYSFGPRVILCDDILTVQTVDIVHCRMLRKIQKGYYETSAKISGNVEKFVLVVPSFL